MDSGPGMLVAIPEAPENAASAERDHGRTITGNNRKSPATPPGTIQPESPSATQPPALMVTIDRRMDIDIDDSVPFPTAMEINAAINHQRKKVADLIAATSPLGSPNVNRRADMNNVNHGLGLDTVLHEHAFQQQILQLQQEQQLEQEFLIQRFREEQQHLKEQHQQQIQLRLQYWEKKKQLEEERERREKEKLEAIKNKDKHEQSAVASSEVKQRLQGFLLGKKQREAAAAAAANGNNANFRNWSVLQSPRTLSSGEIKGGSPSNVPCTHPYRHPLLGKYDDDFPLRKTASEPNLLKVRLKQRVIDRRSSPMMRRKDRILGPIKRKSQLAIDTASSTPDSGPNSPPNGTSIPTSRSSSGSTPIQEEGSSPPYGVLAGQGSMSDLTLYSSPSMPNISLGRPAVHSSNLDSMKLPTVSEAEVRAAVSAQLGMPTVAGQMLVGGAIPFYHALPVMDGDFGSPTSPVYIHRQMAALEQARPSLSLYASAGPITDAQVAQARLSKSGHRPLGRTQSAPLPLGHPMLQGATVPLTPQQYEELLREKQAYEQQQTHNILRQQIRQTVLTRAGSKNHVGNVEEESDVHMAREANNLPQPEVIDLTERRSEETEILFCQQREREQLLQHQRDLMMRHTLQVSEGSAFTPRAPHIVRPLSRALSSPLVTLSPSGSPQEANSLPTPKISCDTGLSFDSLMLKHQCICGDNSHHPEHGGRLQSIWARLQETGLVQRCERIRSRKATLEEIQSCHSEAHTLLFGTNPLNRQKLDMSKFTELPIKSFVRLSCGGIGVDSDTTWNELHTASAARMAVGCVLELAFKVAMGELRNGMAVVRPPGHHAEPSQAMGFCFFNSVSIATRQLRQRLKIEKILIVDWDVHHGNGTQQIFIDDPHVLYMSIHRHDDGNFFPGTGGPVECGVDDGIGFTVNVAWSGGLKPAMGDAEYIAAFRTIIMPIAKEFDPDVVLVSAGFDATAGHPPPLGGYKLSAACFSYMTRQLMQLAGGKVVLVLEGGYDLPAICDSSQECVRALLGEDLPPLREEELHRRPCQNAIDTLQKAITIQTPHWPCLKRTAHTIGCSALEASQKEKEESETVTAMASLSVCHGATQPPAPILENHCNPVEEPMDQDEGK